MYGHTSKGGYLGRTNVGYARVTVEGEEGYWFVLSVKRDEEGTLYVLDNGERMLGVDASRVRKA